MILFCNLHQNRISLFCNPNGWLAALERVTTVTSFKLKVSRLRDKMLVCVGLVKTCLQHGHLFRVAGMWLKCKHLHFACRWINFAEKTLGVYDFQISLASIHQIIHPFLTSRRISTEVPPLFSPRTLSPPSHTPHPCWPQESMCNMLTTATSSVGPVFYSSRTLSPPSHTPHPRWP